MWFLKQYQELYELEKEISKFNIDSLDKALLLEAKQKGFADRQIAHMLDCLESEVNKKRADMGIKRVYKLVDTCAAEFSASTPIIIPPSKKKCNSKMENPTGKTKVKSVIVKKSLF